MGVAHGHVAAHVAVVQHDHRIIWAVAAQAKAQRVRKSTGLTQQAKWFTIAAQAFSM